jgi:restriction system protein
MSRPRNEYLLVELARLPWWVSVIFAVVVFALLRWGVPALTASRPILASLGPAVSGNAWWIAAIFLLPAPFALFNVARRRRLVYGQSGIDSIRELSWQDFERFVAEAYRRQGYRVTERGGSGSDGGIDLELRAKDKVLVVQCKRWKTRTIGVEVVRELYGAMTGEEAHGAVVVSSGSYTPDAIDFARDKPIKLVDGPELFEMLQVVQRRAGEATKDRPVRPDTVPVVTTAAGAMTCPRCGSAMVKRVAKQGASAGSKFWGCNRFPDCRGTRPGA